VCGTQRTTKSTTRAAPGWYAERSTLRKMCALRTSCAGRTVWSSAVCTVPSCEGIRNPDSGSKLEHLTNVVQFTGNYSRSFQNQVLNRSCRLHDVVRVFPIIVSMGDYDYGGCLQGITEMSEEYPRMQ
jgi:hypothetical protein